MNNKKKKSRKILRNLKVFVETNRAVSIMNLVAIIIAVSYTITNIFPDTFREMFLGADDIYNTLSTIALSCIASTMFYIIQSYIPNMHKNKLRRKDAAKDLITIMNIIQNMHVYIQAWNSGIIEEGKEQIERFDIGVSYLKDSYEEVMERIKVFKNTYYDICNEQIFDFLSSIQEDSNFKMFKRLAAYKNYSNVSYLVFDIKALNLLMRYSLEFQKIENGWLVIEDSERIDNEFAYRHVSQYGMMCDKRKFNENNQVQYED